MWTDADQDLALAYEQWLVDERSTRCPSCGTRPDDWIDDDGIDYIPAPFEAKVHQCRGCIARADALEPFEDDPDRHALRVTLVAVDPNAEPEPEREVAPGEMPD